MPYRETKDTGAQRREDNLLMFGIGALSRRLAPMATGKTTVSQCGLSTAT
jgi:hypothetical protein